MHDSRRGAPVRATRAPGTKGAGPDGSVPGRETLTMASHAAASNPVQRVDAAAAGAVSPHQVHAAAAHGITGASRPLPFLDRIQRLFGRHDVSSIAAHVGGAATAGARGMGAVAYATGERIAFANEPDLHTAAHEAAHVVQQRAGVQLPGGVGTAGDGHERHADAVADLVVQGQSVEALLTQQVGHASPGSAGRASDTAVQRKIGFEFESGFVISTSDAKGDHKLAKKDRLLTADGYTVEADELGSYSDVEFVTEPFEETEAGEQRAVATVKRIVEFTEQADQREETRDEPGRMPIDTMRDFGSPVANRYFRPGGWTAQVQVTAGILAGKLDVVLDKLAADPRSQTQPEERQPERLEIHEDDGLEIFEQEGVRRRKAKGESENLKEEKGPENDREDSMERHAVLEESTESSSSDTSSLLNGDSDVGAVLPVVRDMLSRQRLPAEIAGVVALLALYLVRGAGEIPAYGKTISGPLMARTDFGTIFALLPAAVQLHFKRKPEAFVKLVTGAATAAKPELDFSEDRPVYQRGLYNDSNHRSQKAKEPDMTGLTIGAWLRGIVGSVSEVPSLLKPFIGEAKGVDRLTAKHFPGDPRAKKEIESLGEYGHKTDLHGGTRLFGGGKQMPIFEFRGLSDLATGRWVDFAREFHRMIVAVNRK